MQPPGREPGGCTALFEADAGSGSLALPRSALVYLFLLIVLPAEPRLPTGADLILIAFEADFERGF